MFKSRLPGLAAAAAFVLLVLGSIPVAAAASGNATAKCTSEQGQAFIDAGRYEQAVREFTCVVETQ